MSESSASIHYVSTHDEARELIEQQQDFWVSDCGCRAGRGTCARSRHDVCLMFSSTEAASGPGKKQISRADAEALIALSLEKNLVARPFRSNDRKSTAGICFCCDDCCGYFLSPTEVCDKGRQIESTDLGECSQCGACADVCYFKARSMDSGELAVNRDSCYGCGLCVACCPVECIQMVSRG